MIVRTPFRKPALPLRAALASLFLSAIALAVFVWLADRPLLGGAPGRSLGASETPLRNGSPLGVFPDSPDYPIVLVDWRTGGGVSILRPSDGHEVNQFPVGAHPMVARRTSAEELIISDISDAGPELRVYSTTNGDLRGSVAIPDRERPKLFSRTLTLSGDERFAFMRLHTYRTELPVCTSGGPAEVCDRHTIVAVGLDQLAVAGSPLELPNSCSPLLGRSSGLSAVAVCQSGEIFLLRVADGALVHTSIGSVPVPLEREQVIARNATRPVFVTGFDLLGTPSAAVLMSDGRVVVVQQGTGVVQEFSAVPPGKRPLGATYAPLMLQSGQLVVPFAGSYSDQVAEGVSVADVSLGEISRTLPATGLSAIAQAGPSEFFAVFHGSDLVRLNADTGEQEYLRTTESSTLAFVN